MKKRFLLFLLMFFVPSFVLADEIYQIDMNINLEQDGTANITEVWNVEADSGSEWYKQLYNLGNSEISNFTVSMDGELLQEKDWDIDETIDEKAGYYGINYVSEGLELCFGKTDYNRHTFTLNYTVSNFVFNTDDSQILYWTLMPNVTVDNFNVRVSSYFQFLDTLDVWGYGYKGYAYVQNGIIEMSNEGSLNGDYVVLLVKFPLNTFNTTNGSNFNNFEEVLNVAEEGSYEYNYNSTSIVDIFGMIISIFVPILVVILSVISVSRSGYGYINNKVINKKEVPMFREIPCNKDIYYANALIKLNNFGYKETNIFGAIILKWVKNGKIKFINETKGLFNKETSKIDLTLDSNFDNELEKELFNMMRAASGDGILEARELEKWCKKNYSKFLGLFTKIENNEINLLKSNGDIYHRVTKEECKKVNVMNDKIYEDSIKLYGLKKYLDEFSSINTKEVMEVHLWDEYLMFAYLFGIADKVAKQLKNMYPEVMEMQQVDCDTVIFINTISRGSVSAANSARAAAESYSSGGGGFSSGGGGGGSFGGGGSMGGR